MREAERERERWFNKDREYERIKSVWCYREYRIQPGMVFYSENENGQFYFRNSDSEGRQK